MARDDDGRKPMVPSTMRVIFGIIMIIVYVGMGVLLLINYFQWTSPVLQCSFFTASGEGYGNFGDLTPRFDNF